MRRCYWSSFVFGLPLVALLLAVVGVDGEGDDVLLEVFYKISCPHCAAFLAAALAPLASAGLPPGRVKITVLPMIRPLESTEACLEDPLCAGALPPLCALKGTLPPPVDLASQELPSVLKYLACDVLRPGGEPLTADLVAACAAEAGLDAVELGRCAAGPEVFDLLFSEHYAGRILAAIHRLQSSGFPDHIAMPWVFLDGQLLQCSGDGCTGVVQPSGVTPLPQPGSLLYLVCSKLEPQPAACADVHGYEASHALVPAGVSECLSCVETTAFRWSSLGGRGRGGGLGGRRWHRAAGLCADLGLLAGAPGAGLQLAARDPGVLHALRDFLLGQAYWPQVDLAAQPWVSRRQGDHREVETRVECLDVPDGRPHVVQQPPQSDLAGRRPAHQHPRGGAQEALHEFVREPEGQDLGQDDRWGEGKEQGARRRRYLPGERRFRVQVLPGEGAPRAGALGRGRRRHVEE
mmetsp:Transcript_102334/g.270801  ORF Transcript_102334/g.270801 Transcript_102334/m.270801 type:complete len:463 (-) Transcript_102334:390-1778(-)